jgi:hypothetical protein
LVSLHGVSEKPIPILRALIVKGKIKTGSWRPRAEAKRGHAAQSRGAFSSPFPRIDTQSSQRDGDQINRLDVIQSCLRCDQIYWEETTGGAINRSTLKSENQKTNQRRSVLYLGIQAGRWPCFFLLKIAALALRRALDPLGSPMLYSRSNS